MNSFVALFSLNVYRCMFVYSKLYDHNISYACMLGISLPSITYSFQLTITCRLRIMYLTMCLYLQCTGNINNIIIMLLHCVYNM